MRSLNAARGLKDGTVDKYYRYEAVGGFPIEKDYYEIDYFKNMRNCCLQEVFFFDRPNKATKSKRTLN